MSSNPARTPVLALALALIFQPLISVAGPSMETRSTESVAMSDGDLEVFELRIPNSVGLRMGVDSDRTFSSQLHAAITLPRDWLFLVSIGRNSYRKGTSEEPALSPLNRWSIGIASDPLRDLFGSIAFDQKKSTSEFVESGLEAKLNYQPGALLSDFVFGLMGGIRGLRLNLHPPMSTVERETTLASRSLGFSVDWYPAWRWDFRLEASRSFYSDDIRSLAESDLPLLLSDESLSYTFGQPESAVAISVGYSPQTLKAQRTRFSVLVSRSRSAVNDLTNDAIEFGAGFQVTRSVRMEATASNSGIPEGEGYTSVRSLAVDVAYAW